MFSTAHTHTYTFEAHKVFSRPFPSEVVGAVKNTSKG